MNRTSFAARAALLLGWSLPIFCAGALAGCNRNEIKVYRIPREPAVAPLSAATGTMPSDPAHSGLPAGHPDTSGTVPSDSTGSTRSQLTWKTPEGWTAVPGGEMRVASFRVKGKENQQADVSVIPLAGDAGGDAANINRWRGQVGLQAVADDELKKLAQKVEIGGKPADLYDIAGKINGEPARILSAIQHRDGSAWFYKMVGADELVSAQKNAFIDFLKSISFGAPAASERALPPAHPPVGGMGLSAPPADQPSASDGKPKWKVPSDWKELSAGQFLVAKFQVGADNSTVVNVSTSEGTGGGWAANANRWRAQLGLNALSETDLAKASTEVPVAGGKAVFIELNGTNPSSGDIVRIIGAMVSRPGSSWFYKMMGDPKVVEAQSGPFKEFVKSVQY